MIKRASVSSSTLSISGQCRCDSKYEIFVSQDSWNAFQFNGNLQAVGDLLLQLPIKKVSKGELNGEYYLINISDQEPGNGIVNYNNVALTDTINSDKNLLTDCDIMVSKLGMTRGYIYLKPNIPSDLIGSSEFIPYKLKDSANSYFYLYLLLMPQMKNAYRCLETGKTPSHKRVNPAEFLKIKVPAIDSDVISKSNKEIEELLKQIQALKAKLISNQDIVDEVFSHHFSLDSNLRNNLHKGMTFGTQSSTNTHFFTFHTSLNQFSMTDGLRFSARSIYPIFICLDNSIKSREYISIKELVKEDIHRGKSPNYNTSGEIPVVKTAHLTNGEIIISEEEFVTKANLEDNPLAKVVYGDILIASTGKPSIGKVDLMEHKIEMFADGHISILRINEKKCLKKFLVYYLRSVLGSYQIEKIYVGSTNQIEIYPEQIGNIILPIVSLSTQLNIINEIEERTTAQNKILLRIKQLRAQIDEIISRSLLIDN